MTRSAVDPVVAAACRAVDLPVDEDVELLRAHSTSVYLLPEAEIVIRVSHGQHARRARSALLLTKWLVGQGTPVTEPLLEPVDVDDADDSTAVVTFWRYYPQDGRTPPPPNEPGVILRGLHSLPQPPISLPNYPPLSGLTDVLDSPSVLSDSDHAWLADRAHNLVEQYHRLDSALGVGFVHGDAYPGNTLWGQHGAILGDWDEAAIAPRELDLVNTYHGKRFGQSEVELQRFTDAYGWDVRDWPGFGVLYAMRDLHTLTSYIRRANRDDIAAQAELHRRIDDLRNPERPGAYWRAVS